MSSLFDRRMWVSLIFVAVALLLLAFNNIHIGSTPGALIGFMVVAVVSHLVAAGFFAGRYLSDGQRRHLLLSGTLGIGGGGLFLSILNHPTGFNAGLGNGANASAWLLALTVLVTIGGVLIATLTPMRLHEGPWRRYGLMITGGLSVGLLLVVGLLSCALDLPSLGLLGGGFEIGSASTWLVAASVIGAAVAILTARNHDHTVRWSGTYAVVLALAMTLLLGARADEFGWYGAGVMLMSSALVLVSSFWNEFVQLWRRMQSEYEALASEVPVDVLTGLAGRGAVIDAAAAQLDKGYGALLVIDIDSFRDVNEVFTTQVGDMVLGEVARSLGSSVRGLDVVGRFGGDEFIVVIDCAESVAASVSERLIGNLRQPMEFPDGTIELRISGGLATAAGDLDVAAWFARADDALYMAKRDGGNRLMVSTVPKNLFAPVATAPVEAPATSPYAEIEEPVEEFGGQSLRLLVQVDDNDLSLLSITRSAASAITNDEIAVSGEYWAALLDIRGTELWKVPMADPFAAVGDGGQFEIIAPDIAGSAVTLAPVDDGERFEFPITDIDDVEEASTEPASDAPTSETTPTDAVDSDDFTHQPNQDSDTSPSNS